MTTKKWTVRRIIRTIWVAVGLLFIAWLFYSYEAHGVPQAALQTSNTIKVEENSDFILFTPTGSYKEILIFYPGAMVAPKAYAPLCRNVAEANVKVYLVKMPWRLASKGYTKPKDLGMFYETGKTYTLAGHSQGAKMAAQFVYENPALADKLLLIATTHPRDISLAGSTIPVMKIYGRADGLADETSILTNKSKLPAHTVYVRIAGANHGQFGYYGYQLGDNRAGISREQQQAETVKNMLAFIKE